MNIDFYLFCVGRYQKLFETGWFVDVVFQWSLQFFISFSSSLEFYHYSLAAIDVCINIASAVVINMCRTHKSEEYSDGDDGMCSFWIVRHTFGLDILVWKETLYTDGSQRVTQLTWLAALWVRVMSLYTRMYIRLLNDFGLLI